MFTRVDFDSFDSDLNNGPDDGICPMNVCGRVEVVYHDIPEYGRYCGFDITTASSVKEVGRTVNFCVRVLVLLGRRFEKTPIPQIDSLITVYGSFFGRDSKTETIIYPLQDFSFLPGSLSTSKSAGMTEQGAPPKTPWKKIRVTPRPRPKQIISPSPAERNKHKRLDVPVQSLAPETASDSADSYGMSYQCCVSR